MQTRRERASEEVPHMVKLKFSGEVDTWRRKLFGERSAGITKWRPKKKKKCIALQRQSVFATDEGAGTSLLMRNRRGSLGNLRVVWWQRRRQTLMCTEMQRMTQEIGVCSPMSEMRKPKCISIYLGIYAQKQFGVLFPKNTVTREIQSENNVYCSSGSVVTEDLLKVYTIPCCPTWTKLKLLSAAPCFFIPLL